MSAKQVLCTIICPVYNKAKYIRKCFDSILMQKTQYKFKVIVIDDKSTDDSCKIIQEYVGKYPEIFKLYKNEVNMKTLATTIKGYSLIDTKYYCVLDPDDYWEDEDHIEQAMSFLLKHKKYTMYGTNAWLSNEHTEKLMEYNFKTKTFDLEKDGFVYTHTSSTFFLNTFDEVEIKKLKTYVGTEVERCFEGDSFRNMLAMHHGLAFVNNECKSVYNFDKKGIWSSMDKTDGNIINANLFLEAYLYFDCKYLEYLESAKYCIDLCLREDKNFTNIKVLNLYNKFLSILKEKNLLVKLGYPENIVFWLPSTVFGGYETCFSRLSTYMAKNFDFNVFYVDYKTGVAPTYLKNTGVSLIEYEDDEIINLPDNSCVFLPITWAYQTRINRKHMDNTKMCFWWAHPCSYDWTRGRAKVTKHFLLKFIKKASDKKAIHFMDSECERSCRDVVPTCKDPLYLPVFIQPQDVVPKEQLISEEEINASWIGRLDGDKICSLLNILHNFENYKTNKKKKFHIIGIGDSEHLIDISKYPSVEITKIGKLVYEELDKYLLNHVDVMFGMGTSLLEAAKLGIPCALVKILEKESLSDDYISLFNLDKYILGYTDDDIVKHMKKDRMQDILDGIINNKSEYIAKTTEYLSRYHTIQASAYRFIHNIGLSGLSFAEYDHYGKKRISVKRKIKTCFYKLIVGFAKILPVIPKTVCDKLSKKIRKYY